MSSENDLIVKKLNYLNDTKGIIKNAIIEKGQAVSDDDTFREYAEYIMNIETGGPMTQEEYIEANNLADTILGDTPLVNSLALDVSANDNVTIENKTLIIGGDM